jgi:hypothetical protein
MQVHGTLESIPAILENAYQEVNISPESGLALSSAVTYEDGSYDSVTYEDTVVVEETVETE